MRRGSGASSLILTSRRAGRAPLVNVRRLGFSGPRLRPLTRLFPSPSPPASSPGFPPAHPLPGSGTPCPPFVRSRPHAATSVARHLRARARVPVQLPRNRHPRPVPSPSHADPVELAPGLATTTPAGFSRNSARTFLAAGLDHATEQLASSARSNASAGHNQIAHGGKSCFRTGTRRHLRTKM